MNVVVVAPHPDDETIGCGGSIRLHGDRGDRVAAAFLTSGELGIEGFAPEVVRGIRELEAEAAARLLGIAALEFFRRTDWQVADEHEVASEQLATVFRREEPAIVYLPHPDEWHPDHRASAGIVTAAIRKANCGTPELRGYEVWTPLSSFAEVEDITQTMHLKLRAVRCYASQLRAFRYDRALRGLAAYRGALAAKCRFAEVFSLLESPAAAPE